MNGVEISGLHAEMVRLRESVRDLLLEADDPRCFGVGDVLSEDLGETLAIALIGQYNAGKSSIVKALAPNADVVIDANVATDRVVEATWQGLRVVDTPGVRAGRPDHDDLTQRAIASSDLLIFVITADLFDATIADYFRAVIIDEARAGECLLVVNKSTQDSGDRQVKLAHIEDVLRPLSSNDVRVVLVDARARLWAEESADDDERDQYLQLSNFGELTAEIDAFARRSGLRARLTTPAYQALDVIDRALEALGDDAALHSRLEALRHQRQVLLRHRNELEETVRAAIASAGAELARVGVDVAAQVQPSHDEQALRLLVGEGQVRAERQANELDEHLDTLIRAAAQRVSEELQDSRLRLDAGEVGGPRSENPAADVSLGLTGAGTSSQLTTAEIQAGLKKIATFFGDNARPGQPAHALIYKAGKTLRVKFKPWGAVKAARRVGKVAEGLGAALVVLEIVNERRRELAEARESERLKAQQQVIRSHFVTYSEAIREDAEVAFTTYVEGSYNAGLAAIDGLSVELVRQLSAKDSVSAALLDRRAELAHLLNRIHQAELGEPVGEEHPDGGG